MTSLLLAGAQLFSGSVSKTILFNQMSLNLITISLSKHFHNFLAELVILPDQGIESYFSYFLTGFMYLQKMTSNHLTVSINN